MVTTTSATPTDATLAPTDASSDGTTAPETGSEPGSSSSGEPPTGAGYRVSIDIDTTALDTDVSDFVLPIRLDPSIIELSLAGRGGTDLRFYDDDTLIPHEIEAWSDQAALVWVKVPVLSGGGADQIELRIAEPFPADPLPTTEVWSDYVLVYHFNDEVLADGDAVRDASGLAFDGSSNALVDQQVEGLFGPAFRFDGEPTGNSHIAVGGPPELEANPGRTLTIEVWFQRSPGTDASGIVLMREGCCLGYAIQAVGGPGPFLRSRLGIGCCTPDGCCGLDDLDYRSAEASLPLEPDNPQWHSAITTFDRAQDMQVTSYLDGSLRATEFVPDDPDETYGQLFVGSNGSSENFPGVLDELRMSAAPRSEAWALFHHQVMTGQHITFQPAEPLRSE